MGNATTAPPPIDEGRRRLLRTGALAVAGAALGRLPEAGAMGRGRQGRRVAVFGGGIAGLTAAQELALRGFEVTVFERRAWGGKARSTEVPGSAAGGRKPLPGEHGYRVPFGFYRNLPDTMGRIPFGSNPDGVLGNLVPAPQAAFLRSGKRALTLPIGQLDPRPYTPRQIIDLVVAVLVEMQLPAGAATAFATRLAVFLSSCEERRTSQWETVTWLDFIRADRYSADYRKTLGAMPQFTQASKPETTSAAYMARFFELLLYSLLGFGSTGPAVRVLDGPTNESWIDPWIAELGRLGVSLRLGGTVEELHIKDGAVRGATVQTARGPEVVTADWYVCALPVEHARTLCGPAVRAVDPRLAGMDQLGTAWMNGVMLYLDRPSTIVEGHAVCSDSPWAISFIPQAQFWRSDFGATYGDGRTREKLSVAIADWTRPGILFDKPASDCSPPELLQEVWEQVRRHVNGPGAPSLTDEMLVAMDLDPGMSLDDRGHLVSHDALVLPTAGTARHRPDVRTAVRNLVLCGDYLQGRWIITTMEAANHSARRAVNAILDEAGSSVDPVEVFDPYDPPEWEPFKAADRLLYGAGQPNAFDVPRPRLDTLLPR